MRVWILFLFVVLPVLGLSQAPDSILVTDNSVPVIFQEDTLFFVHSNIGPYNQADRASIIEQRINTLVSDPGFVPDSLYVHEGETTTDILYQDRILFSVTNEDGQSEGSSRQELAERNAAILRATLSDQLFSEGLKVILIRTGLTILELFIIYLLIFYINKLFRFTRRWLVNSREKILKGIKFRGYEFLDTDSELRVALFLNNILRWVVIILVFYLALPILFSIFPWTRGWAETLFGYILNPVKGIGIAVFNYIPDFFTIIVIYTITKYVVKFVGYLADEIEKGNLVINGFYADWAKPTFNIVKVLIYAFMFVAVFNHLPGSDSDAFKGVSVFLGVLFSLGSSSAIANVVAGFVITYMRPFKIGDRIKIGDITGDVIDKSMLVTRVRTVKNEDITIPNSAVLSGHTVNYTTSAKELGLIVYSTVTIGYDVSWKTVHQLLIDAALSTKGIIQDKNRMPFVLQTSLDDFYVSYQINAYTEEPHRMASIYSELHEHIQDKFNEANVEIMSPHYRGMRKGNSPAIPADYRDTKNEDEAKGA